MIGWILRRAVLLALAVIAVLAAWELRDVPVVPPAQSDAIPLSASRPVAQEFRGAYTGLRAIDVLVEPGDGGRSADALPLVLELYDARGVVLRAATARPTNGGRDWTTFRFAELPDSRGAHLGFRLVAPDVAYRDGLLVWQSVAPQSGHGRLYIADQPTSLSLVYRPHYRPTALEMLAIYTRRLADTREGVLQHPAVYGSLVLVYLVILAVIVVLLVRFVRMHFGDKHASVDE